MRSQSLYHTQTGQPIVLRCILFAGPDCGHLHCRALGLVIEVPPEEGEEVVHLGLKQLFGVPVLASCLADKSIVSSVWVGAAAGDLPSSRWGR